MDQSQLVDYLIVQGASWIRDQRLALVDSASPIPSTVKQRLDPYFATEILDKAKVHLRPKLENPPFYSILAQNGVDIPLDFSTMLGITFDDTIVIAQSMLGDTNKHQLLFHELVHVTQYHFLGIDQFMNHYVLGWASNGFDYYSIPLEVEAYKLDRAFAEGDQFSVHKMLQAKYSAA